MTPLPFFWDSEASSLPRPTHPPKDTGQQVCLLSINSVNSPVSREHSDPPSTHCFPPSYHAFSCPSVSRALRNHYQPPASRSSPLSLFSNRLFRAVFRFTAKLCRRYRVPTRFLPTGARSPRYQHPQLQNI